MKRQENAEKRHCRWARDSQFFPSSTEMPSRCSHLPGKGRATMLYRKRTRRLLGALTAVSIAGRVLATRALAIRPPVAVAFVAIAVSAATHSVTPEVAAAAGTERWELARAWGPSDIVIEPMPVPHVAADSWAVASGGVRSALLLSTLAEWLSVECPPCVAVGGATWVVGVVGSVVVASVGAVLNWILTGGPDDNEALEDALAACTQAGGIPSTTWDGDGGWSVECEEKAN